MCTPRCWSRTLAGARSPVRDSSLPAMRSCVTSMARSPSSSASATRDRAADRIEEHHPPFGRELGDAGPHLDHVQDRCIVNDVVGRIAPAAAGALQHDLAWLGRPVVDPERHCRRRAARARRPATSPAGRPARRRRPCHRRARCARRPARGGRAAPPPAPPPGRPARLRPRARRGPGSARSSPGPRSRARCDGSPTQVTIGLRTSRTWQVWLQRRHGRIRSGVAGRDLGHQVRVGDLGPRHLDAVAHARRRRPPPPGRDRPPNPAGHDGDPCRHRGPHRPAQVEVEASGCVDVRAGLLDREDGAPHDDEVVDAVGQRRRRCAGACSGVMPAHGASSSHERRRPTTARRRRRRGRPPARSRAKRVRSWPHSSPRWLVRPDRNWRTQAVLAGVDLHAVAARAARPGGGRAEAVDHGCDVLGLHPLRDLAGVDLGHPRRRPQLTLAVGRRALPAGVAERGEHERAVVVDGVGDLGPAVGRTRSASGAALVGPVRRVDAGLLGDDDPAAARRPAPVVGEVAIREAAVASAQVGDVGAEQDAVASGAPAEGQRAEQLRNPGRRGGGDIRR